MKVNAKRLISDMRALARIGQFETGVDRTAFSARDIEARLWLCDRMREAGLEAELDEAGNAYGMAKAAEQAVLIGSHTDTVPKGGWLDGSLGVIYGLEIARCVSEQGRAGTAGVDVVSFQDEEGTFQALYGSRMFCGEQDQREVAEARSRDGTTLADAIAAAGISGKPPARLDRKRHTAFMEAHIEQGPRLEAAGLKIGVVTAIVGIRSFRIAFEGRADHAGTTPMDMREDAGAAAADFMMAVGQAFHAQKGPHTVWNTGGCSFAPGAVNVVPAAATLAFQFRDDDPERIGRMEEQVHEIAAAAARRWGARVEVTRTLATEPTPMDAGLADAIERSARTAGAASMRLPSGAGHDALVLARHVPTAMLFVPSIGGRSHHVSEDTAEEDIVLGCQVLLGAVEDLIARSA